MVITNRFTTSVLPQRGAKPLAELKKDSTISTNWLAAGFMANVNTWKVEELNGGGRKQPSSCSPRSVLKQSKPMNLQDHYRVHRKIFGVRNPYKNAYKRTNIMHISPHMDIEIKL